MKIPRAPKGLDDIGKKFWKQVLSEYEFEETHDFERLAMAAKCLDDVSEVEEIVKTAGRFTENRYGGVVEHPGVKTIRDTRMLFIKIIRELNLDISGPESRPPRKY